MSAFSLLLAVSLLYLAIELVQCLAHGRSFWNGLTQLSDQVVLLALKLFEKKHFGFFRVCCVLATWTVFFVIIIIIAIVTTPIIIWRDIVFFLFGKFRLSYSFLSFTLWLLTFSFRCGLLVLNWVFAAWIFTVVWSALAFPVITLLYFTFFVFILIGGSPVA